MSPNNPLRGLLSEVLERELLTPAHNNGHTDRQSAHITGDLCGGVAGCAHGEAVLQRLAVAVGKVGP
jgi:hypothetical protein